MTSNDEAIATLLRLPSSALMELGTALISGLLRYGFSTQTLHSLVGTEAENVERALGALAEGGFSLAQMGVLCMGVGRALVQRDATERDIDLILSGPDVTGTPVVDTRTTVMSLFEEAQMEVVVSSYVFRNASEFFGNLASKHDADERFRVRLFVDLSHQRPPPHLSQSIVSAAFATEFMAKHWPGKRYPEIWYDPRSFDIQESGGGVLHAKSVIIDQRVALITSANFTSAAQTKNIEAGVLIRQSRIVKRLHAYFSGLISTSVVKKLVYRR